MKYYGFVGLCLVMIMLGGCVVFDALFGTNPQGTSEPSLVHTVVGTVLNGLIPGSGMALTGLGGLYAAFRARQWKKAMVATAEVIEEHGEASKAVIKEHLVKAHEKAGVVDMVKKICIAFDDDPETPIPTPPAT